MKLYHGSYTKIREIDLSKSLPNKDFGQGFYVTKYREHAEDWATKMANKHKKTEGAVTEFDYTESDFARRICKIKHFDDYNDEWLDFVVMNRDETLPQPVHDFDIVEGPVADDKIQHRLKRFLAGKITREDFMTDLSKHAPTHQICFCTVASLQLLKHSPSNEINLDIIEINEKLIEQLMLDNQIDETQVTDIFYNSDTFTQLADIAAEFYLKPWQEIYELLKKEVSNWTEQ
jgi:hypothetical protein